MVNSIKNNCLRSGLTGRITDGYGATAYGATYVASLAHSGNELPPYGPNPNCTGTKEEGEEDEEVEAKAAQDGFEGRVYREDFTDAETERAARD